MANLTNFTNASVAEVEPFSFPSELLSMEQRLQGGIALHIFLAIYACYALALICLNYFIPALHLLSKYMNLDDDIAGASLMAFGSSAPGLFLAIIGTFVTGDDLGLSDILGSSVFNICALVGICGILVGRPLKLDWWSITRDCSFYTLSVILLIIAVLDATVYWFESLIMLVAYIAYILTLCFDKRIKAFLVRSARCFSKLCMGSTFSDNVAGGDAPSPDIQMTQNMGVTGLRIMEIDGVEPKQTTEGLPNGAIPAMAEIGINDVATTNAHGHGASIDDNWLSWTMPKGSLLNMVMWALTLPITLMCYVSIIDCRRERFQKFFAATFAASIIVIGLLTYFVSWMVAVIQITYDIPSSIIGYTALAIGTSTPDLICSLAVARQGQGNMALANAFGSNIMDILINLSVPWLILCMIPGSSNYVEISTDSTYYVIAYMASAVTIFYLLIVCYGFTWNRTVSVVGIFMYAIFLIGSILLIILV